MVQSMTGFAAVSGEGEGASWSIEIRGVNAKGLDVRMRLPEKLGPHEAAFKTIFTKKFERGNINISVRVDTSKDDNAISLDEDVIDAYLNAAVKIRSKAKNMGLKLSPSTAADILALRGSLRNGDDRQIELPDKAILDSLAQAADAFETMRKEEGAFLAKIIGSQIAHIEDLVSQSAAIADGRKDLVAENLRTNVARILNNADGLDEGRLSQELALLAVKSDVTEEIDRLGAHVEAARVLLAQTGSIGRKFDFLMQEFNREANTLCSKSQNVELTQLGLDLKATIDQMREQVQNVE
jgi:uncharacterized protein (TIGR00255 family)